MNAKKEPSTRLYVVRDLTAQVGDGEQSPIVALVRGTGVPQVTRHMADKSFSVKYAEQGDIIAAVKAGVEEEFAGTEVDSEAT